MVAGPVRQVKQAEGNIWLVGCRFRAPGGIEAIGWAKSEVEQNEEALRTMEALGQNMAWLLKKIHA
jgi:hypothetical protein